MKKKKELEQWFCDLSLDEKVKLLHEAVDWTYNPKPKLIKTPRKKVVKKKKKK